MIRESNKSMSLSQYKGYKTIVLRQLGITVSKDVFNGCQNEIQVDNRARQLILN